VSWAWTPRLRRWPKGISALPVPIRPRSYCAYCFIHPYDFSTARGFLTYSFRKRLFLVGRVRSCAARLVIETDSLVVNVAAEIGVGEPFIMR
jgi:hypothetical protein